jgi:hypothetical protein
VSAVTDSLRCPTKRPISAQLSVREVAGQVGETTGWVHKRLAALRAELEGLSVLELVSK